MNILQKNYKCLDMWEKNSMVWLTSSLAGWKPLLKNCYLILSTGRWWLWSNSHDPVRFLSFQESMPTLVFFKCLLKYVCLHSFGNKCKVPDTCETAEYWINCHQYLWKTSLRETFRKNSFKKIKCSCIRVCSVKAGSLPALFITVVSA